MRAPLRLIVLAGFLALALALTALGGLAGAYHTGHAGPSAGATTDLGELWAVPPIEVAATIVAGLLYWAGLRRSRVAVAAWRQTCFAAGLVVLLAAVVSPLGGIAQQGLLSVHMLQHTLIGAVAPLLLLLGLPRALVEPGLGARARALLDRLTHPVAAFTLWTVSTAVWLLPGVHHAVLDDRALWVLQQASFLAFGLLLWAPVLETPRAAPAWFSTGWKGGYMTGVWTVGLTIANIYWFSGTAFYDGHAQATGAWGLEPLEDQANAGTVMMVLHCLLAFGAITILFFRQAREGELRQRMIEAGIDPARVEDAIRAGSAAALARRHGVAPHTRAGID